MMTKNTIFTVGISLLLLTTHAAYAGSWWNVNGDNVYVPNRAKKAMRKAISQATAAGGEVTGGGTNIACQAVLCLAPYVGLGTSGGPSCIISKEAYFNIRVYIPFEGYSPNLTKAARGVFLDMCPAGPNKPIAKSENMAVGEAFSAP